MITFSIETLVKQRDILLAKKEAMLAEINTEIADIETGIKYLSGRDFGEKEPPTKYDDENPNYIKGSIEE